MSKLKGRKDLKKKKILSLKKRCSLIPQLSKQLRNAGLEDLLEPICSELWLEQGLHLFICYDSLQVFLCELTSTSSSDKYFMQIYAENIIMDELRRFLFDKLVTHMALSEETDWRHFKKRKYRERRFKALVRALQTSNKMAPFLFQWLLEFSYTLGREYKNRLNDLFEKSTIYHANSFWIDHLNGWWEEAFRCGKHVAFEYSTYHYEQEFDELDFTQALSTQDFEYTFEVLFAGRENISLSWKDMVKESVISAYLSTLFDATMIKANKRWDKGSRQEALERVLSQNRLWCNLIYVYWVRQWLSVHEGRGYLAPLTVPDDVPFWGTHLFPENRG